MKFRQELESLVLPLGEYAIFGSGPMEARGIRVPNDLDIIVTKDLRSKLLLQYPDKVIISPSAIRLGNIEIFCDWQSLTPLIEEMIATADIIDGLPYVQLSYVLQYKVEMGREKDMEDIVLIREYQKKN